MESNGDRRVARNNYSRESGRLFRGAFKAIILASYTWRKKFVITAGIVFQPAAVLRERGKERQREKANWKKDPREPAVIAA